MRKNKLIIGLVAIVVITGLILIIKAVASRKAPGKSSAAAQALKGFKKATVKKAISKGKGGLTVRILNTKKIEIPMRVKAFKVVDAKSSVYAASTVGGRMQELLPGTYDIETDTVPQKIFKNIKVSEGKETVEDLGCVTGAIVIKAVNYKKAPAYYPLRILYGRTNEMITASMTNKTLDIIPGVYDIEIGTSPRQYKKDIKVEAGKETIADVGCLTGVLVVKTTDENKKDVRCSLRITKADTNEIVSSGTSNKPIELGKGAYNIDLLSSPRQNKKDVDINTGEETIIGFTVTAPAVPQRAPTAPRRSTAGPRPQPVKAPARVQQ